MSDPNCPCGEQPRCVRTPDYWERFDRFLKRCNEPRLMGMLRTLQARLGSAGERPEDARHAREIAHRLHNLRTASSLRADLERLGAGKPGSEAKPPSSSS